MSELRQGVTRIALAVFHIVSHTFAAVLYREHGHFYHVAKGGAELIRGIIETLPIIGRLFVWNFDARLTVNSCARQKINYNWFMVKINNPEKPDFIDRELMKKRV